MKGYLPMGIVKPANDEREFHWSLMFHRAKMGMPNGELMKLQIEQFNYLLSLLPLLVGR